MSMIMDGRSLRLLHAFLMFLQHLNPALGFISGVGDANDRCIERERQALLEFRKGLVDDYDMLSSWGSQDQKKNCCKWKGVHCSKHPGHVLELDLRGDSEKTQPLSGKLSSSLLELHHLSSLDLSYNDFNMSQIPEFLGSFNNLKHLYLLEAEFGGTIPYELGNLSHLESIDISANNFNNVANLQWLSHFEAYDWADIVNRLPYLTSLSLSSCDLPPIAPSTHTHFNYSKSLTIVALSDNHQNSSIFQWLLNFNTSLVEIDLSSNQLRGSIPDALGKMNSLESLNFDENQLEHSIPKSFGNICTLSSLSLSNNRLSGQLVEFINILSGCAKNSLEMLDLSLNQITGSLPNFSTFSSLKIIYDGTNNLTGTVPKGIGNLHQLEVFCVSNNSMHGVVTEVHLSNLSNLWSLDLSLNSLALQLNKEWVSPFQLRIIYLSSCKLGPRFPSWLQTQWNISILDISDTGISDKIPKWFMELPPTLQYLDVSSNQLEGQFSHILFPSKMTLLSIAANLFLGTISSVCKITGGVLNFLDLSGNLLSGEIPDCFMHWRKLVILDLSGNNFSGKIPTSLGSLSRLQILLKFVDLGNNGFSGQVPGWIGEGLPVLNILILSSNKLSGSIPFELCWLKYLRILDLSLNDISGNIPQCFNNFTAMAQKGDFYSGIIGSNYTDSYAYDYEGVEEYVDDATIVMKGRELEYRKYLGLLKIINLAHNNLTGKLPGEISSLLELVVLNISKNNLIGEIPQMIGQLKQLQSLDMSRNQFSNEIPSSMSRVIFSKRLGLVLHNLSGKIPSGTQLQSFDAADFTGNWALCGPPLPNKCPGEETPNQSDQPTDHDGNEDNEKDGDEFEKWFFAAAGFGFFIGFWGICGPLLFKSSWRGAFFLFLDNTKDWLYATKLAMCMKRLRWKFKNQG
ncbi:hypothetical protein RGQ29_029982 [Quercus rubra]|uniref:Leucine-rich repeat-containing N-terminal plant-type domain-containing protein n=1 Tax=Quercus rubra TaxID=3512 RepID=A0AAN7EH96_QUERU|nr:hypothetical protein RGQ29_029982 [Quercus rubra]